MEQEIIPIPSRILALNCTLTKLNTQFYKCVTLSCMSINIKHNLQLDMMRFA